jgi:RNA polymerase sigma-70 factor (ECF subfamily)
MVRVGQATATLNVERRAEPRPTLAAFDEVVERYESPLRRFLFGLVQDHELAADLCQETFLSAFRALPKLSGDLNLDAWLYTIALNHARGVLRRRRILRWVSFVSAAHDRAAPGSDLASRVAMRDELRRMLERLPIDQRACLLLHADGFRYAEIAHILGCSLGAVKQRIFRGRERCLELYRLDNPLASEEDA